jgi:diguanylate cyclase
LHIARAPGGARRPSVNTEHVKSCIAPADKTTVSEQIIELGLQQGPALLSMMDRVLGMLPDAATESEKLRTAEFRKEIQFYRDQIRTNKPIEPIARKVLETCQEYFRRARLYRLEREHEYVEMIEVLRDGVSNLAGQATTFNAQLTTSSDRFNRLVDIDDIREIKHQISREVRDLRRAVEDKQKQDEENLSLLSRRVEMLQAKLNRAKDEAATDALTKLSNRGTFDKTLARWVDEHSEHSGAFVLAMVDIDDFKKINDTHGHPVGDRVLIGAAQLLAGSVRPADFVARYGGEEFALLLSGMKIPAAETRMDQLLKRIAVQQYQYEGGILQFTVSCGMAEYHPGDNPETMIQRADEALYDAKRKGKNRVISQKKSLLKTIFGKSN